MPENESGEGRSNPSVYTSFTAREEVTLAAGVTSTNTTVMLTNVNMVLFCGDFTSQAAGLLLTLPEGFRPARAVRLPVIMASVSVPNIGTLLVSPDGSVSCDVPGTVCTNGMAFSINDNWY